MNIVYSFLFLSSLFIKCSNDPHIGINNQDILSKKKFYHSGANDSIFIQCDSSDTIGYLNQEFTLCPQKEILILPDSIIFKITKVVDGTCAWCSFPGYVYLNFQYQNIKNSVADSGRIECFGGGEDFYNIGFYLLRIYVYPLNKPKYTKYYPSDGFTLKLLMKKV